ncbi:unnamed protein product [Rhizoctonia solani]|uniref:HAT C-terminal dimerisation domain-containing protein n=1 Tax=Rhizoctonia solani TaxID=456999 RepID=A0A8H3DT47_9AGAM|nr:unnamed protein product [Rhizoctonia solani]
MVLNPAIKYSWIDKYWTQDERKYARSIVNRYMLEYAEAQDFDAQYPNGHNSSSSAVQAQLSGLDTVFNWADTTDNHIGSLGSVTPTASPIVSRTVSLSDPPPPSPLRPDSTPVRVRTAAQRSFSVELEHKKYIDLGLWDTKRQGPLDLVKHWATQGTPLPYLHAIAMDVLPAQASSVSSERVFSSSKLTCTRARNKISTSTVEALQILKYALRHRFPSVASSKTSYEASDEFEVDSSCTLDLMVRLGDHEWGHDAILEAETASKFELRGRAQPRHHALELRLHSGVAKPPAPSGPLDSSSSPPPPPPRRLPPNDWYIRRERGHNLGCPEPSAP